MMIVGEGSGVTTGAMGVAKLFRRGRGVEYMAPAMDPLPMLPHVLLGGWGVRNSCMGI